ncbi:MAG: LacI family DNA-binding transcriptional regulator [bacterium]|nr:LacI family DNA-binding transcriptional regulator [bacterium]
MVTIRDVAKRAGVAPITVSRVINKTGYVSDETRERVETAIAELHYIPNSLSQSLRFKKTNTLALIVSDITNPFWTTVTRGVEDASSEDDLSVILCNTDEQQDKLESYVNLLLQRQTDGFLLVPISRDSGLIQRIQRRGVPVVVLDRPVPGSGADSVYGDSEGGAYALVRYLLDLGHRRIGLLTGPLKIATSERRLKGYQRALTEFGIPADPGLILAGEFKQTSGYEMVQRMLRTVNPLPTALFAANNLIAVGAMQALHEYGARVPDDISLVTFDDLPLFLGAPFLTLAAQAPYELGWTAAKRLIAHLKGEADDAPKDIVLPVQLMIRASSAPPRREERIMQS